jgi:hypothetical protein
MVDTGNMATVGFRSASELVRLHTPFDAAVAVLMDTLEMTHNEAVAAMHAAHERADWGLDHVPNDAEPRTVRDGV